jgi:aryl-alcohol dehydrogenase-like predicted oxidoreductase
MDDPDRIFAAGGAMEAALEARKAGKIRYIGFTGHKSPAIHLKMLATAESHQFRFDTVQMPLNVMDAHYDSFEKNVLPVLVKNDIGVLGMKPMGDHIILESKTASPVECLALRHELANERGDYGLRLHADPRPGGERRTEFPAYEARRNRSPSGEDRAGRATRQVRALQDDSYVRWHIPESSMARLRG